MIDNKSVLAMIPARGGSKGIPRKNILDLAGRPLIAWTIEEAKKSKYIDRLILSSEDDEIIGVAKAWGCEVPFKRPQELAQDDTPGIDPVIHALHKLPDYDYIVLLQPTSPLRTGADIDGCLELCLRQAADTCVSVAESKKSPYWMYLVDTNNFMQPLLITEKEIFTRQNLPKAFVLNGAVYVGKCEWLLQTKKFVGEHTIAYQMPADRSIDIDEKIDFLTAEILLKKYS